jgi:hypothetical protein
MWPLIDGSTNSSCGHWYVVAQTVCIATGRHSKAFQLIDVIDRQDMTIMLSFLTLKCEKPLHVNDKNIQCHMFFLSVVIMLIYWKKCHKIY